MLCQAKEMGELFQFTRFGRTAVADGHKMRHWPFRPDTQAGNRGFVLVDTGFRFRLYDWTLSRYVWSSDEDDACGIGSKKVAVVRNNMLFFLDTTTLQMTNQGIRLDFTGGKASHLFSVRLTFDDAVISVIEKTHDRTVRVANVKKMDWSVALHPPCSASCAIPYGSTGRIRNGSFVLQRITQDVPFHLPSEHSAPGYCNCIVRIGDCDFSMEHIRALADKTEVERSAADLLCDAIPGDCSNADIFVVEDEDGRLTVVHGEDHLQMTHPAEVCRAFVIKKSMLTPMPARNHWTAHCEENHLYVYKNDKIVYRTPARPPWTAIHDSGETATVAWVDEAVPSRLHWALVTDNPEPRTADLPFKEGSISDIRFESSNTLTVRATCSRTDWQVTYLARLVDGKPLQSVLICNEWLDAWLDRSHVVFDDIGVTPIPLPPLCIAHMPSDTGRAAFTEISEYGQHMNPAEIAISRSKDS